MMMMMNRNITNNNTCQLQSQQQQKSQQQQQMIVDRTKNPIKNTTIHMMNGNEIYSNYTVKQQQQPSQTTTTSSGSETDISTSTENLSAEEHYVLKTTIRQEPQGEETFSDIDYHSQSKSQSSTLTNNTLIIHGNNSLNQSINSYLLPYFYDQQSTTTPTSTTATNDYHSILNQSINFIDNQNQLLSLNINNDNDNPYSNINLLKFNNNVNYLNSSPDYQQTTTTTASSTATKTTSINSIAACNPQLFINSNNNNDSVIKFQSSSQTTTTNDNMMNPNNNQSAAAAINLQQPMLNDYLNSLKKDDSLMFKNFNLDNLVVDNNNLPLSSVSASSALIPNSNIQHQYEKSCNLATTTANATPFHHQMNDGVGQKSLERFSISRSHPDLSKFSDEDLIQTPASAALIVNNNRNNHTGSFHHQINLNKSNHYHQQQQHHHTIDLLLLENTQLRNELDSCYKKIQKFQKVESEIQKIYRSYDELMQSSEKKEKFEREARYKLEIEVKKLQKQNKSLQERLDSNGTKKSNYEESDFEKELNKRGTLISYLLMKNKELINYKERQEIELEAQRLTLQEQRNHIEILDTALINAQNNIMTLENELRAKQGWEEKTLFLEKALSNLQSTNERRLQMEKRIRTYLEKELEKYKNIHTNNQNGNDGSTTTNNQQQQQSSTTTANSIDEIDTLKASIVNYEKKIIDLEAEVSKWEQKYLEENTLRSIEVSAASAPKDAKIAALERTSHESEKLIAEARNERLKHMDEIHIANRKCAELESQLKDLNFKLAEKETIINVLQKHSDDRDAVLQKTLRFTQNVTSARHSKSASTMGLVVGNAGNTNNHNNGSNSVNNNNNNATRSATNSATINLDEQIKEIESSQLSNKDSIINALRNEKERYPNHYNNWRL
uniref:Angiomotin C-terminal domain-containing protein n=1 Tax=Dermatophagoides pteronyssinus TaxID=6956 RepID=A0A6P6Y9Y3_DERPT|nr:putative uncharacterized protein DDB_G0277255 [Dermatophagoides pteronyssinus]